MEFRLATLVCSQFLLATLVCTAHAVLLPHHDAAMSGTNL